ncbi:ureidoglycolate lyase [Paracoccus alkenifer]|uniref:Ureidoglycolate lyase n=1 Tax=Paracoccus alkenifer TaxID=65735 RepID=A0A1H6LZS9_9RHOB|nr:ureidoglycolate lyase [Paracoccus alkenifer]SEH90621.1 ureidoglycolate lyase [Paracoccus alkenifer]
MSDDRIIRAAPLTAQAFAPWGQVIEAAGDPDRLINAGRCGRWHDRAAPDVEGRAGISVFRSQSVRLPYRFRLVERHPLGSQAFLPMTENPFLVIVAPDEGGHPGRPLAFVTAPGQGINLARGAWHGVLTPLADPGLFAVVDRCAEGPNLQEYRWDQDWTVLG